MMNMDVISVHSETDDTNGEGEGVWSPEIEQAFQEALKLFPPCGRRKHILQEEGGGKMYGRNELIARYIEQQTGHRRTRKQVSSHIQVLSRREARSRAGSRGVDTESVSPASSITASSIGGTDRIHSRPDSATSGYISGITPMELSTGHHLNRPNLNQLTISNSLNAYDFWEDRPIVTRKIRLVEFSAFIEQRKSNNLSIASATTNGNGAGGNNQAATLSQAAVLAASLAAANGVKTDFDQTTAAAAAVAANGHHLQMPPFATSAAYPGGLTPYQMNNSPTTPNPNLSAQFASAAVYSQQQQQHHHHHNTNGNQSLHHNSYYNQINPAHHASSNMNTAYDLYTPSSQLATPAGFHRHSYVKIDYRQPSERQATKTERIDIREIQDKFPDIGGPDGLFQRGPRDSFFLVKFWAELDLDLDSEQSFFEDQNSYFGFSSQFETVANYKDITCSTKACSYGHQVVEKVEKVNSIFNSSNNTFSYAINRSPMCEFMIQFIKKLRQLPRELSLINRILENFTVLQIVTSESSSEILLCIAYVFEIASLRQTSRGSQYHVYKLTKD